MLKIYIQEITNLNAEITSCNDQMDKNLNNLLNVLTKNPERNKLRIFRLNIYLRNNCCLT